MSGGRLAVQSYLDYHGAKLVRRFDAGSYISLCRTMLSYDIGRDRGGIAEALRQITAQSLIVSVDSDRLFFAKRDMRSLKESQAQSLNVFPLLMGTMAS